MIAFFLKKIIANSLSAAFNLDNLIKSQRDRYVLSYHRVLTPSQAVNEGVHHSLWITPDCLESQIKWMRKVGDIVDIPRILDTSRLNYRPLFAITFDDGWKDNYEQAFPILKKYQVPVLIFVATEAINCGELFWPQDIASKTQRLLLKGQDTHVMKALIDAWPHEVKRNLKRRRNILDMVESWIESLKLLSESERKQRIDDYYRQLQITKTPLQGYILSWDEAREMQKHGISFGSHSHRHSILEGMSDDIIEQELNISKRLIEDKLQIDVNSFCYPNGRYNGREGAILSRCGYSHGFRLDNMSLRFCDDIFYIPRFLVSEYNSSNQAYFKLRLLQVPLYRAKPHKSRMVVKT